MVDFARHSLDWFSHNYPGVPSSLPETTFSRVLVDMEYPMMVNDGTEGRSRDTIKIFLLRQGHEIAHTWFPLYGLIMKRATDFMDEGLGDHPELLYRVGRRGNWKKRKHFLNISELMTG